MAEGASKAEPSRLKKFFSRSPNREKSKSPSQATSAESQGLSLRPARHQHDALHLSPAATDRTSGTGTRDIARSLAVNTDAGLVTSEANPVSLETTREELWSKAYEAVYAENPELVRRFEDLVAEASNVSIGEHISASDAKQELLRKIADRQYQRLQNRQWTWSLLGSNVKIRDTVDAILKLVNDSSALISVGMTLAPPHVSFVWSGVCALLPFITNNFKEQAAALDGLQTITKIMFSYRVAEQSFLVNSASRLPFFEAVFPLYRAVVEYQVAASLYFSKSTLGRMAGDVAGGSRWEDALRSVKQAEQHARTSTTFLGFKDLKQILSDQSTKITDLIQRLVIERTETNQIVRWISAIPYDSDHRQIKSRISQAPLGQWILQDQQYVEWCRNATAHNLLLEGTVGQGKTSLICGVIEDLLYKAKDNVAFFYCSRSSSTTAAEVTSTLRNRAVNCVRSLLAQMTRFSSHKTTPFSLLDLYEASYSRSPGGCALSIDESVDALLELLQESTSQWTIVIDALDECLEPIQLLKALGTLYKAVPSLKILISSRKGYSHDVRKSLPDSMVLEIANKNIADLNTYVETRVNSVYVEAGFSADQANRLKKFLQFKAQGNFRWVELKLEIIFPTEGPTSAWLSEDIDLQLDELDKGFDDSNKLTDAYRELFARATRGGSRSKQPKATVAICNALVWVLCAFRPFTAHELVHACSVDTDGRRIQGLSITFLMGRCANLLVERARVGVGFAHSSVADFLKESSSDIFGPTKAHLSVTIACLRLLEVDHIQSDSQQALLCATSQVETPTAGSCQRVESLVRDYAENYWPKHCRQAERDPILLNLIPEAPRTSLHFLVRSHSYSAMQVMIATGTNLEGQDRHGYTPLHEAVRVRDQRLVRMLLVHDVSVNQPSLNLLTPLHTAAVMHHAAMTEILLRAGAQPSRDDTGRIPVEYSDFNNSTRRRYSHVLKPRDKPEAPPAGVQSQITQSHGNAGYPFKVLIQSLCERCEVTKWIHFDEYKHLANAQHAHWESLSLLEQSAARGCPMCEMIISHLPASELYAHWDDTQIFVEYLPHDFGNTLIDLLVITVGMDAIARVEIEVFLESEVDLTGISHMFGRPIPARSDSTATLGTIKSWFDTCKATHSCHLTQNLVKPGILFPSRLLDLDLLEKSGELYLVNGKDLWTEYAFFSHPFGPHIVPEAYTVMMQDPARKVSFHLLEKSLQDAIAVVRRLGIRYLWVDKLCVDWNTTEDPFQETKRLSAYVTNASLVVNAGKNQDVGGLFRERSKMRPYLQIPCTFEDGPGKDFAIVFRPPIAMPDDAWAGLCSRAWMVQEIALAPRLLVFGEGQLYWKCCQTTCCEGSQISLAGEVFHVPTLSDEQPEHIQRRLLVQWYQLVEQVSSKSITFLQDKLQALEGIAMAIQGSLSNPDHTGGLWNADLNRGLLWYAIDAHNTNRIPDVSNRTGIASWSWASVNGGVSFSFAKMTSAPRRSRWAYPTIARRSWTGIDGHLELLTICDAYSRQINYLDDICSTWTMLFDTGEGDLAWFQDSTPITAIVINRIPLLKDTSFQSVAWGLSAQQAPVEERWKACGLLLKPASNNNDFFRTAWLRVGIFIGPWCDGEDETGLEGWELSTFPLEGSGEIREDQWTLTVEFLADPYDMDPRISGSSQDAFVQEDDALEAMDMTDSAALERRRSGSMSGPVWASESLKRWRTTSSGRSVAWSSGWG